MAAPSTERAKNLELLLIRHGLPLRIENNDGTPADPPLAPLGHRQAQAAAEWLRDEAIDAIYVSPLQRARETSAPLESILGLVAAVEPGIAEYDAEEPSYIPMEELKRDDPAAYRDYIDNNSTIGDPVAFQATVLEAIDRIVAGHRGQTVAVVCHGMVINSILGHAVGTEPGSIMIAEPTYSGVTRISASSQGHRTLKSFNETHHLRGVGVTEA